MRLKLLLLAVVLPAAAAAETPPSTVEKPAALVADGIPPVPAELAERTRPYMEFRSASFAGWHPHDGSMLITTRFGNTAQLHRVAMPMGAREQLSFETEPASGRWSPAGDVLVAQGRRWQRFLSALHPHGGRLDLVTDGRSRNNCPSAGQTRKSIIGLACCVFRAVPATAFFWRKAYALGDEPAAGGAQAAMPTVTLSFGTETARALRRRTAIWT